MLLLLSGAFVGFACSAPPRGGARKGSLRATPGLSPDGFPQAATALLATNNMPIAARATEAPRNRCQKLSFVNFELCMVDYSFGDDLREIVDRFSSEYSQVRSRCPQV